MLYEDDSFKLLKEALCNEYRFLEETYKTQSEYANDKHSLSSEITQSLKEL